ncbi:short neurotoxin 1 [Sebastes umbrosus]|uniref:short neurotoxin 1 n=1 Tax=Sebastes umbrosus TaxID=72105 RepID=UPI00189FA677|nr:short neurotoxin 1 [Sebastes umbrosus]
MKVYLLLLLLLPAICSAQKFNIQCYGEDFLNVNNMLLTCTSKVRQACYTRDNGEKGCTLEHNCSKPGWTCCHTNQCNA